MAVALAILAIAGHYAWSTWTAGTHGDAPLTAAAKKSTLRVVVTERGNLESSKTVDGVCEVSGYDNKIIFIAPEGTEVKKGDVVVRFDTAKIDREIAQQEIKVQQAQVKVETTEQEMEVKRNEGESAIAEAELELALAKLDLVKYEQGDYEVELNNLKSEIELAQADLAEAEKALEITKTLVKKGFREPKQLHAKELTVNRYKYYLESQKGKLRVLENFDYQRKITELKTKAELSEKKVERAQANAQAENKKAQSEHDSAKAMAQLEEQQMEKLKEDKEKCVIKAMQDGVVAYANEYWYDSSRQIREGAIVYFRQKIFSLPDMSAMQAQVNVHESMVKKVQPGQKAEIRVDAFPKLRLKGTVKSIAPLADSTRSWMRGGVKEYTTIVTIDELPDTEQLKPGMTAEVNILVNELPDALVVPVQAVTEHQGHHYAYVQADAGIRRRNVTIGESNQKFVQILDGLAEGEHVALDARQRGITDFEEQGSDLSEPETQPSATKMASRL